MVEIKCFPHLMPVTQMSNEELSQHVISEKKIFFINIMNYAEYINYRKRDLLGSNREPEKTQRLAEEL